MTKIVKATGPQGTTSVSVEGVEYKIDENGHFTMTESHLHLLLETGFTAVSEAPQGEPSTSTDAAVSGEAQTQSDAVSTDGAGDGAGNAADAPAIDVQAAGTVNAGEAATDAGSNTQPSSTEAAGDDQQAQQTLENEGGASAPDTSVGAIGGEGAAEQPGATA